MSRNKYHAKQVQLGKLKFASRAEAARYLILADQQRRGEIKALELQKVYDLHVGRRYQDGKPTRVRLTYRSDFAYMAKRGDAWELVVEDVKGYETDLFRFKKSEWQEIYDMPLTIVRMRKKDVDVLLRAAGIV